MPLEQAVNVIILQIRIKSTHYLFVFEYIERVIILSLVDNIQELCKKRGITLSNLQKELGFGNAAIYRWNESSPSFDKLLKVAEYFKVPTDQLVFGFNRQWLASGLKIIKCGRTLTQFAKDTGIEENEIHELCAGTAIKQPSIETIAKIMTDNHPNIVPNKDIYEAAGYDPSQIPLPPPVMKKSTTPALSPKEEHDIARDLEKILSNMESQEAMSFYDGEPLDDESKELLRISLENSMRLAKQMAKRKFTPKKYRKEE